MSEPEWKNRIVGHDLIDPRELMGHSQNYRKHGTKQREAMSAVFEDIGWLQSVIVSKRTGTILDGHMRVDLAISNGESGIPVVYVDLSEQEEKRALATIDPLGALADVDKSMLGSLIQDGFGSLSDQRLDHVFGSLVPSAPLEGNTDPDVIPGFRDSTVVQTGDIWQFPDGHRLICGDCTIASVVDDLIDGQIVDMVWTDPPYGVDLAAKNKWMADTPGVPNTDARQDDALDGDSLSEDDLRDLLRQAFRHAYRVSKPGGVWHIAAPQGPLYIVFGDELNKLGIWRQTIQWVKNNATFSPMGVDYHWQAEPVFHGWKPGAKHAYYGDRKQTTVWNIDRPSASPEHPTMKPIALVERALENHTRRGEIVFDPFMGSGTTLLAAERLGRIAYGVEISPVYCDVIIRRYEEFTGQKASLIRRVE